MGAAKEKVVRGHPARWLRARRRRGEREGQSWLDVSAGLIQKLACDSASQDLGEQGRHRIAYLTLRVSHGADHGEIVRERLKPGHLAHAQPPVGPVEWAGRRPRLGLKRPGRLRLRELQQE